MFFLRLGSSRTKNFRLMGTGVNPLLVYATGVGIVAFWVFGAYALSIFGPVVGFVVTAGIIAAGIYFPHRYHAIRAARLAAGCCTKCGYDLHRVLIAAPSAAAPYPRKSPADDDSSPSFEPEMAPSILRVRHRAQAEGLNFRLSCSGHGWRSRYIDNASAAPTSSGPPIQRRSVPAGDGVGFRGHRGRRFPGRALPVAVIAMEPVRGRSCRLVAVLCDWRECPSAFSKA